MSSKKSRADLEAENKFLRSGRRAENIASIINTLIRWGGVVATTFFVFRSIAVLSGKETNANINLSTVLSIITSNAANKSSFSWGIFSLVEFLVGCGGIAYGIRQKRLKQRYIAYRSQRYEYLEKRIDPKRTSSMLTSKGDTRPEDM